MIIVFRGPKVGAGTFGNPYRMQGSELLSFWNAIDETATTITIRATATEVERQAVKALGTVTEVSAS